MNQSNNKGNESSKKKLPTAVPPPPPPPPRPMADGPIFRSVALAPPPSALDFGIAIPPPKSFTAPAPPPPKSFSQSRAWPKDELKVQAKAPISGDWSWKIEKLEPVPVFHLLERTAVHIKSTPVETVTARISGCLKSNSITTSYQNARVDCLADSLLKFSIQLWQGSDDSTVIIEIQRKQGCCIEMQRMRAVIAEAAQSGNVEVKEDSADNASSVVQKLMNTSALPTPVDEDCVGSALAIGQRMLESKRLDENRMGLESLCTLTDSCKVIPADAKKVASSVLSDSNLQALLERYFVQMKLSGSDMSDMDTMDYEDGQFVGCCHILSLRLLANALESGKASGVKIDLSSQFWSSVLRALYYNANVASSRPLEASLSIKSLRLLQTMEPGCLSLAPSEQGLYDVLASAHQFGRQHNHSLEVESKRLMGQLDGLPVY